MSKVKLSVLKKQNNSSGCLICGMHNDSGLKARFYEVEGGILVAYCKIANHLQSYPGVCHGGILGALLDEVIGRAEQIKDANQWGMTSQLSLRYLHPVSDEDEVVIISKIYKENRIFFHGVGLVCCNDKVATVGQGQYVKMDMKKITSHEFGAEHWFPVEDDVNEVELESSWLERLEEICQSS